jgi:hypothetical protein
VETIRNERGRTVIYALISIAVLAGWLETPAAGAPPYVGKPARSDGRSAQAAKLDTGKERPDRDTARTASGEVRLASSPQAVQAPAPQSSVAGNSTCGAVDITQSTDPTTVLGPGFSVACQSGCTVENDFARSFDLSVGATAGLAHLVRCVEYGVDSVADTTGAGSPVTINLFIDTSGGAPNLADLVPLAGGSITDFVPDGTAGALLMVDFTANNVLVPADATLVVTVESPNLCTVSTNDAFFNGANNGGQTAPSYIRAPDCGLGDFVDLAAIGFPDQHMVLNVGLDPIGLGTCGACPAGSVDSAGYCWVVHISEPDAPATCARVGLTGINFSVPGLQWTPEILADVSAKLGCTNLGDTGCCATSMWYDTSTDACFTHNFSADSGGADFFNWSGELNTGQHAVNACNCPGACCDPSTLTCEDFVPEDDCAPPKQFTPGTLCDDLSAPCGCEPIIDADGIVSAGHGAPAAQEVFAGAPLLDFPSTGSPSTGLDWFDNDHDGLWSLGLNGDDLHSEDPGTCATADRNGVHDLGADCKVLDINADLADGQQVDCDLETSAPFTEPHVSNGGCPSSTNNIRYHDANGNGTYEMGEDIVLDLNGNGVYDCVACVTDADCPADPGKCMESSCDRRITCDNPKTACGGFQPSSCGSGCECFMRPDGSGMCASGAACPGPCGPQGECPDGQACFINTCCGTTCLSITPCDDPYDNVCARRQVPGCCTSDDECPDTAECVDAFCDHGDATDPLDNVCRSRPVTGCCTSDAECPPDTVECQDSFCDLGSPTNPLDNVCGTRPVTGCCTSDADCPPDTAKCVDNFCNFRDTAAPLDNFCDTRPFPGCCVTDDDCPPDPNECIDSFCNHADESSLSDNFCDTRELPGCRVACDQKGSVLIYAKVELKWDALGRLKQDTILTINNDYPDDVHVQWYFINGDEPLAAVLSPTPPFGVLERSHRGWNWVDCQVELTESEPTYIAMSTGLPMGCQPFTVLDPGTPPGRPDPDAPPGHRMLRGYAIAFAVDNEGREICWDHLFGSATLVDYSLPAAWEYCAHSFQTVAQSKENPKATAGGGQVAQGGLIPCSPGDSLDSPGSLYFDGSEYDSCFDKLLFDFFAVGSTAFSIPALGTTVMLDTDLTLLPVSADLRQDPEGRGPITTKAKFDIWNQNEDFLSGTTRCITCWDQALLSTYDPPNNFLFANMVQTHKGKARIDGIESEVCENCAFVRVCSDAPPFTCEFIEVCELDSRNACLVGVAAKILSYSGAVFGTAITGNSLVGQGKESATILYDIREGPDPLKRTQRNGLDVGSAGR